ncbi:Exosome complex exonuclease RRP42 [Glycine soja]
MVQQELEWVPQMSLPALRWLKIKMFGLISYFLTCNILLFNTITNNSFKYIVLLTMICLLATQVQAELGKPSLLQPHKGKVFIYIDCSSTTEPAFEEYSIGRGGDELRAKLSNALQCCLLGGKSGAGLFSPYSEDYAFPSMLRAGIDLLSLIVVEGKICWDLYIDGLLLVQMEICFCLLYDILDLFSTCSIQSQVFVLIFFKKPYSLYFIEVCHQETRILSRVYV